MSGRNPSRRLSRRSLLGYAGGSALAAVSLGQAETLQGPGKAVTKLPHKTGFRHSVARWCFEKQWDLGTHCRIAKNLGFASIELVPVEQWPTLKKHGLVCALAASHAFDRGVNNPKYQAECLAKIQSAVEACAAAGFPNVITFTGFREGIPDDVGLANCVAFYKRIVGLAEKNNVTLCLEMLNSRVREEMKGHPGYQGDHTEYVMEIIRQVGSPRLKLLFDVYHVQIMDGDLISRIRQYHDAIGHVHVAGCPGRGELDDHQEINFRAVATALADAGYRGFVGQEFVPTGDPEHSLRQALQVCTV